MLAETLCILLCNTGLAISQNGVELLTTFYEKPQAEQPDHDDLEDLCLLFWR